MRVEHLLPQASQSDRGGSYCARRDRIHTDIAEQLQEGIGWHIGQGRAIGRVDIEGLVQPGPHGLDDIGGMVRLRLGEEVGHRLGAVVVAIDLVPGVPMPFVTRNMIPQCQRGDGVSAHTMSLPEADILFGVAGAGGEATEGLVEFVGDRVVKRSLGAL